jgi:hypothetical protein
MTRSKFQEVRAAAAETAANERENHIRNEARLVIVFEPPNGGLQLRRAISIQPGKDYLRSMLSRRQLQGFVGRPV